jgi:hypothetical protein
VKLAATSVEPLLADRAHTTVERLTALLAELARDQEADGGRLSLCENRQPRQRQHDQSIPDDDLVDGCAETSEQRATKAAGNFTRALRWHRLIELPAEQGVGGAQHRLDRRWRENASVLGYRSVGHWLSGALAAHRYAAPARALRIAIRSESAPASPFSHLSMSKIKSMKRRARRQRTGVPSRETENFIRRSNSRRLVASSITAAVWFVAGKSTSLVPRTYLHWTDIVTLIMLSAIA